MRMSSIVTNYVNQHIITIALMKYTICITFATYVHAQQCAKQHGRPYPTNSEGQHQADSIAYVCKAVRTGNNMVWYACSRHRHVAYLGHHSELIHTPACSSGRLLNISAPTLL